MSTKYSFAESDLSHFITLPLVEWVGLFSRESIEELLIENSKFCVKIKERFQSAQEELDTMKTYPGNIGMRCYQIGVNYIKEV